MLASILASGLAAGAIYALVGVTYNTMFSTSRVMSFTAGQLAMLGGVFGSMFMLKLGMPILVGFVLTLLGCAIIGVITEFVAVRPVLKSLDQHLYVLSTLALALMIQQVTAIKWGTEPQPFPRLIGWGSGVWDEKFWLPVVACAITIIGLEYLYRRTLVGRAFLAIAEDNFAARALGLPERNLRIGERCLQRRLVRRRRLVGSRIPLVDLCHRRVDERDGCVARQPGPIVVELFLERNAPVVEAPERKKEQVQPGGCSCSGDEIPAERPSRAKRPGSRNHELDRCNQKAGDRDVEPRDRNRVARSREVRLEGQVQTGGVRAFDRLGRERRHSADNGAEHEADGLHNSNFQPGVSGPRNRHAAVSRPGARSVINRIAR